jgi:DNA-directed RNA polymerase specialized sigma24 family protein
MRQLQPHEVDEMVAAYGDGATTLELAVQFGIHRSTVGQHLATRGIDTKPPGLHLNDVPAAADLYRAGWSLARIAKKFGTTDNTVRARLLDARVRMRPQQGGRVSAKIIVASS